MNQTDALQSTIRQQDWKIDRLTKENRALEARLLEQQEQIQGVRAENLEVSEKIVKLDADLASQTGGISTAQQLCAFSLRSQEAFHDNWRSICPTLLIRRSALSQSSAVFWQERFLGLPDPALFDSSYDYLQAIGIPRSTRQT